VFAIDGHGGGMESGMALGNRNGYIRLLHDSGVSRISLVNLLLICGFMRWFMVSYVLGLSD